MTKSPALLHPLRFLACHGHWVSGALHFLSALALVDFAGIFEIDYDEGYNLAKGALFAAGEPMYSGIWSDHPPLLTMLLAGVHTLFPWDVGASRILILLLTSGMVCWVHLSAARIVSEDWSTKEGLLPGLLAGFSAALLLMATDRIIRISFAVDVGTPSIALSAAATGLLVYAWQDLRPRHLAGCGFLLGLACGTKLFALLLVPVLVLSIIVATGAAGPRTRWSHKTLPALLWWTTGLLSALALVFGPNYASGMLGQLVVPHSMSEPARLTSSPMDIVHPDRLLHGLALLALPLLWISRKRRAVPFVLWFGLAALALNIVSPLRASYHLLILVPAVVLVGAALGSGVQQMTRGGWLFVAATVILSSATLAFAVPRFLSIEHWKTGAEPAGFYRRAMRHLDGFQGYEMATSRQTLAFRAGLLVPPQLAVTSNKRFQTGYLDASQVLRVIRRRKVAFVFEDRRWPSALREALPGAIGHAYCVVMARPRERLWQRRDLVQPGKCREVSRPSPAPASPDRRARDPRPR